MKCLFYFIYFSADIGLISGVNIGLRHFYLKIIQKALVAEVFKSFFTQEPLCKPSPKVIEQRASGGEGGVVNIVGCDGH